MATLPADPQVSEVFPRGAHHKGGEVVTLHGAGFFDLGLPRCVFGAARTARGAMQPLAGEAAAAQAAAAVPREAWGWTPRAGGHGFEGQLPLPALKSWQQAGRPTTACDLAGGSPGFSRASTPSAIP